MTETGLKKKMYHIIYCSLYKQLEVKNEVKQKL